MNAVDHDKLVKLLGSKHPGERDAAALAIERLRPKTGLTWADLLRTDPARPRIIITPWEPMAPILMRGVVPSEYDSGRNPAYADGHVRFWMKFGWASEWSGASARDPIRTLTVGRLRQHDLRKDTAPSPYRLGAMMNEDQLIAAIRQRASNPATRTDFADRVHRELGPPAGADAIEVAERDMGCHFHQFHRRLFREVGNGGFGPGAGLIGIPGGSLDAEGPSMIELRRGLLSDDEKLQMLSVVPLCDWGCGIWSCVDCETGAVLSISEFGLRDLEQGLHSRFEDWISGVNLWDSMVVVDEIRIKHPRTRQWVVGQTVTGMKGKILSGNDE